MPTPASRKSRMPELPQNCYTVDDEDPSQSAVPRTHSPVPACLRTPNPVVYATFFRMMRNLLILLGKTTSQKDRPVSCEVRILYKQF